MSIEFLVTLFVGGVAVWCLWQVGWKGGVEPPIRSGNSPFW